MTSIIFLLILFVIIIFVLLFLGIYYQAYKRNVNQSLVDSSKSKKMISPFFMGILCIIGGLVIYVIISLAFSNNQSENPYLNASYAFDTYYEEDIEGYLSVYSIDENAGYDKQEEVVNNTRYTIFTREDSYDTYHPSFIIYVEYLGDLDLVGMDLQGTFYDDEMKLICGKGFGGSYHEKLMVVGDSSIECYFELELYYYDREEKNDEIGEGACDSSKITILLPSVEQ
ncbi:MAG: hypothetical protein ACI4U3_00670 [Traorella sp.]